MFSFQDIISSSHFQAVVIFHVVIPCGNFHVVYIFSLENISDDWSSREGLGRNWARIEKRAETYRITIIDCQYIDAQITTYLTH